MFEIKSNLIILKTFVKIRSIIHEETVGGGEELGPGMVYS